MAIELHKKVATAHAQVETALHLYFAGRELYSVITIAGAADELLGQLLRSRGSPSSLDSIKAAVCAIHQHLYGTSIDPNSIADGANAARNALKHWAPGSPPEDSFDVVEEARNMLNRAIDNYWSLEGKLTPKMERFQRESMAA